MTAQPVATVPNAVKAPPAPIPGGHRLRAFADYLGSAAAARLGAPTALLGSTALSTSLRAKRPALKNGRGVAGDGGATAHPRDPMVAGAAPLALAATQPDTPLIAAEKTDGSGASAQAFAALTNGRAVILGGASAVPPDAKANAGMPTAANANSFTGFIAAGAMLATADSASAADQASTGDATLPGAGAAAALNEATPTVTPAGSPPPRQAAAPATAFMVNRFGAPGASSAKEPATQAAGAMPDKQAADPAASDPAASKATSPSAVADAVAALPGAAALNARIIAGASTLSDHPNQAATAGSGTLTQPAADPNAGVLPPSQSAADGKGHDNSGLGLSASANGVASAPATGAHGASDPRNFAAAFDHAAAQAQTAASPVDSSKSTDGSNGDAAAATASASGPGLPLAQTEAGAGAAAPSAAPNDASLHPALIALPASVQVALNLKQALSSGTDEIQIQLKPASLGTIDVKLNVNHDGRLTAVISADRSDTLNLLKQDASQLQQSLRDAGFSADSGSLSFNLRSDMQPFAQSAPPQPASSAGSASDLPSATAILRAPRQHSGTLDIEV